MKSFYFNVFSFVVSCSFHSFDSTTRLKTPRQKGSLVIFQPTNNSPMPLRGHFFNTTDLTLSSVRRYGPKLQKNNK